MKQLLVAGTITALGMVSAHVAAAQAGAFISTSEPRIVSVHGAATEKGAFISTDEPRVVQAIRLPNTPAGRAAGSWLRAVNSGDSVVMRVFGRDSMVSIGSDATSVARRFEGLVKFHAAFGEVTLEEIRASSDTSVSLVLRSGKTRELSLFMFYAERTAPYRLAAVFRVGRPE